MILPLCSSPQDVRAVLHPLLFPPFSSSIISFVMTSVDLPKAQARPGSYVTLQKVLRQGANVIRHTDALRRERPHHLAPSSLTSPPSRREPKPSQQAAAPRHPGDRRRMLVTCPFLGKGSLAPPDLERSRLAALRKTTSGQQRGPREQGRRAEPGFCWRWMPDQDQD